MTPLPDRSDHRVHWIAAALAIAVTAYDVWMLATPVAPYFAVKPGMSPWRVYPPRAGIVLAILIAQALLFRAALLSPRQFRIVALVVFGSGILLQYGFLAGAGGVADTSVISLLTGFDDFPDRRHAIFTWPTLFQCAEAMHFETHLFDGESSARRFGLRRPHSRAGVGRDGPLTPTEADVTFSLALE